MTMQVSVVRGISWPTLQRWQFLWPRDQWANWRDIVRPCGLRDQWENYMPFAVPVVLRTNGLSIWHCPSLWVERPVGYLYDFARPCDSRVQWANYLAASCSWMCYLWPICCNNQHISQFQSTFSIFFMCSFVIHNYWSSNWLILLCSLILG